MRKATFFYLLRRGLLGAGGFVRDGLVMAASKFKLSGITHPAQGSAEFNGSSDYIDMGEKHIANDLGITDAFTFGAWANYNADSSYDSIVTMWNNSAGRIFWFGFNSSEQFHYNISLTGGDKARNIVSVPTNDWVYVNLTYDGANLKLHLDGSVVDNVAATGTLDGRGGGLTETLLIGMQDIDTLGAYFNGNLANVAIWNRALTSDEINAVMWKGYQSLTDNEKSGLQAWYSLDDVASPAASLATMEALAVDKDATIENKAAVTAAINALS